MGRHHKFAVGISVALLLGAASPALAAPGNGHAYGKDPATKPAKPAKPAKPQKPDTPHPAKGPKAKQAHLNGGGTVGTTADGGIAGGFSVQVRKDKLRQGHFNFDATGVQVRCRDFRTGTVDFAAGKATFTNVPCSIVRNGVRESATLTGTFNDAGNPADGPSATPGPDTVDLTVTSTQAVNPGAPVKIGGPVTGNIKVH
jgi:hypothetical protein